MVVDNGWVNEWNLAWGEEWKLDEVKELGLFEL